MDDSKNQNGPVPENDANKMRRLFFLGEIKGKKEYSVFIDKD